MSQVASVPLSPTDAAEQFIEQMGLLLQNDRLPRIAGRIWGLLLYEGTVFGLQEMADRLQVSRASISTNARLLAEYGLIRRVGKPGSRQDYYELGTNPFGRMLHVLEERLEHSASAVTESAALIPADNPGARARVEELSEFYARTLVLIRQHMAETGHK
ncbi:hypothetical protein SAMN02983003_2795 [Devosia enhydra]|uniref:MarR family protein n=1 Tax=Devosia enhydra TaxID=665118 RepID=A0A1K2HZQ8_9HYPH|nr:hypothetical protein [Devosia enhydra]SFZ85629.1 hypothetical protein SAMN02983003_2795 [Devosia enhydra]